MVLIVFCINMLVLSLFGSRIVVVSITIISILMYICIVLLVLLLS